MQRAARSDPDAVLALDVYVHRLSAGIAAMTAAMRGIDVLVFTGGVGEHSTTVRSLAAERLPFLGVAIDPTGNAASGDRDVTAAGAAVSTMVITAREDLQISREVRVVLTGGSATPR